MHYLWIIFTFGNRIKIYIMDWLAFFLRDILVWVFENILEPTENLLNYAFIVLMFVGLFVWIKYQAKYNAEAKANPDQIK